MYKSVSEAALLKCGLRYLYTLIIVNNSQGVVYENRTKYVIGMRFINGVIQGKCKVLDNSIDLTLLNLVVI